jgi:hypothetical protein
MILAAALTAQWILWGQHDVQVGVTMGKGLDIHLLAMVPDEGCAGGMRVYTGAYGEMDKAIALVEHSKVCALVEKRAKDRAVALAEMKSFAETHPWSISVAPGKITFGNNNSMEFDARSSFGQYGSEAECQKAIENQANGRGPITNKPVPADKMSCHI